LLGTNWNYNTECTYDFV